MGTPLPVQTLCEHQMLTILPARVMSSKHTRHADKSNLSPTPTALQTPHTHVCLVGENPTCSVRPGIGGMRGLVVIRLRP